MALKTVIQEYGMAVGADCKRSGKAVIALDGRIMWR